MWVFELPLKATPPRGGSLAGSLAASLRSGYAARCAAVPSFPLKCLLELLLAVSLQLSAEWRVRGGVEEMARSLDFLLSSVTVAAAGKFYSMWRTRFLSLLLPVPSLFRAGFALALCGYSFTFLLTSLRLYLVPSFTPSAVPINPALAAVYTGAFMAAVSNVRYQIMQGVIDPVVDRFLRGDGDGRARQLLYRTVLAGLRVGNGFLGSWLAIHGMRLCGFFQYK
ncbi:hypothetical protein TeGR_g5009 [Tetraparma gracilis]|uniref:ADP,ATP carrier protein n=1 Tax=Tetraparma gracilis TaxID=2962635 RepID=A0ABQ6MWM4_9STRA|nr:hypothetical protein TeGR_g5009 [Tetraparma gracilis]